MTLLCLCRYSFSFPLYFGHHLPCRHIVCLHLEKGFRVFLKSQISFTRTRGGFIKENKKVRKQERTLSTQKAIKKEKKENTPSTKKATKKKIKNLILFLIGSWSRACFLFFFLLSCFLLLIPGCLLYAHYIFSRAFLPVTWVSKYRKLIPQYHLNNS